MIFQKVVFYLDESIVFEGGVSNWRASESTKTEKKWSRRGEKTRCIKLMKILKKCENPQKQDLHDVPRIPTTFDVRTCVTSKKHKKNKVEKVVIFEVRGSFLGAKSETK